MSKEVHPIFQAILNDVTDAPNKVRAAASSDAETFECPYCGVPKRLDSFTVGGDGCVDCGGDE